jgi:hypothetical protein
MVIAERVDVPKSHKFKTFDQNTATGAAKISRRRSPKTKTAAAQAYAIAFKAKTGIGTVLARDKVSKSGDCLTRKASKPLNAQEQLAQRYAGVELNLRCIPSRTGLQRMDPLPRLASVAPTRHHPFPD